MTTKWNLVNLILIIAIFMIRLSGFDNYADPKMFNEVQFNN